MSTLRTLLAGVGRKTGPAPHWIRSCDEHELEEVVEWVATVLDRLPASPSTAPLAQVRLALQELQALVDRAERYSSEISPPQPYASVVANPQGGHGQSPTDERRHAPAPDEPQEPLGPKLVALAVDFGTSTSKLAWRTDDGTVKWLTFPSIIAWQLHTLELAFGTAAHAPGAGWVVRRSIKTALLDPPGNPNIVNGTNQPVEQFMVSEFLKWMVKQGCDAGLQHGPTIYVTYPSRPDYQPNLFAYRADGWATYPEWLRQVCKTMLPQEFPNANQRCQTVTEPEAAFRLLGNQTPEGDVVILDIGAGTSDVAWFSVPRDPQQPTQCMGQRSIGLAGDSIDHAICDVVLEYIIRQGAPELRDPSFGMFVRQLKDATRTALADWAQREKQQSSREVLLLNPKDHYAHIAQHLDECWSVQPTFIEVPRAILDRAIAAQTNKIVGEIQAQCDNMFDANGRPRTRAPKFYYCGGATQGPSMKKALEDAFPGCEELPRPAVFQAVPNDVFQTIACTLGALSCVPGQVRKVAYREEKVDLNSPNNQYTP